ncbi:YqgQ family protein [Lactovum odontotermitis]
MKKFGYINLMPNRRDAIYFMKLELKELHKRGIIAEHDPDYFKASLILRRESKNEENRNKIETDNEL